MKTKGIRLRWLYETCYEIVLPGGTVILTDPDLTLHGLAVTAKHIQRVDYIICTHTHFDHTSDIGYLVEKFGCKVLVGQLSAQPLCQFFNLPYSCIYPVGPDDVFEFPDVTLHFFRGKHTAPPPDPTRGRPASALETTSKRWGIEGHGPCDQYGWMEFFNFVLIAPNNQTLLMCGGIPAFRKAEEMARRYHPDLLICQTTGFNNVADYAAAIDRFGAQAAFPSHHENCERKYGIPTEQVMAETSRALEERNSMTTLINPEQFQWYEIATHILPC